MSLFVSCHSTSSTFSHLHNFVFSALWYHVLMMLRLFHAFKKTTTNDSTMFSFHQNDLSFRGYLRNLAEYAAFHCLFVNNVDG